MTTDEQRLMALRLAGIDVDVASVGPRGRPGADGRDGADGEDGANGKDGADGEDGKRGPRGYKGEEGRPGWRGVPGGRGPAGPNNLFIQSSAPVTTQETYAWFETLPDGGLTLWIETGE